MSRVEDKIFKDRENGVRFRGNNSYLLTLRRKKLEWLEWLCVSLSEAIRGKETTTYMEWTSGFGEET
jgi:hypothetical protein